MNVTISDEQIDEAIETVFAAYPAESPPVERGWLRQEVRKSEAQIQSAAQRTHDAYQNRVSQREDFIDQMRAFRGRRGWVRILAVLVSCTGALVGAHALFRWTWPVHYLSLAVFGLKQSAGAAVLLVLAGLLAAGTATFVGYRLWFVREGARSMDDMLQVLRAELTETVRVHTLETTRAAISGQIDHEESKGSTDSQDRERNRSCGETSGNASLEDDAADEEQELLQDLPGVHHGHRGSAGTRPA
ncbi:hypothetical protein [Spirillospora sp. CA-128828]|uniref:hypothetical protein n=1 Tax=Spirillospora sp. CA-128828 TaxID=3240033 RepID=UPI003D8D4B7E